MNRAGPPGARLRRAYDAWVDEYRRFARMRGFRSFNDWPYHRRGFLECWLEPGFHRFWQVWNPGIAYFVHRLYLALGGRRRWAVPTVLAFALAGLAHTIVVAPLVQRWSYSLVVTFALFGLLTVVSRRLATTLRQERWPRALNAMLNLTLVAGSFDIGFRVDGYLA